MRAGSAHKLAGSGARHRTRCSHEARRMTQNIYHHAALFEACSRLDRPVHGLDGTPEQVDSMPALDDERDRPMMAIVAAQR
jgi:hypothetical protein